MIRTVLICLLLFLVALYLLSFNIDKPFYGEHDWNGVRYGNIARNYLRVGILNLKFGQIENSGFLLPDKSYEYFTHYPPVLTLLIAFSYHLFGISEWSTRLVPIIFSASIVVMIFLVGQNLFSIRTGIVASLFALIIPLFLYFGKTPVHESVVTFFAVFSFYNFLKFQNTFLKKYYSLFLLGMIMAELTTWAGFFLLPAIFLSLLFQKEFKLLKSLFLAGLVSLLVLVLHFNQTYYLTGSFLGGSLSESFLQRSSLSESGKVVGLSLLSYPARLKLWFFTLFTATLSLLTALWFVYLKFTKVTKSDWWLLSLGFFGLTYFLIFPNSGYIHDYLIFYLLPFFTLAGARIVVGISAKIKMNYAFYILTVFLLIIIFFERNNYLMSLNNSQADKFSVDLAKQIKLQTSPNDVVLIEPSEYYYGYKYFLKFYGDRDFVITEDHKTYNVKVVVDQQKGALAILR